MCIRDRVAIALNELPAGALEHRAKLGIEGIALTGELQELFREEGILLPQFRESLVIQLGKGLLVFLRLSAGSFALPLDDADRMEQRVGLLAEHYGLLMDAFELTSACGDGLH